MSLAPKEYLEENPPYLTDLGLCDCMCHILKRLAHIVPCCYPKNQKVIMSVDTKDMEKDK